MALGPGHRTLTHKNLGLVRSDAAPKALTADQNGLDLQRLARREKPSAEGGEPFGVIKALLLTLIVTAVAGANWLVDEGSAAAVALRHYRNPAARGMIVLFVFQIMAAAPHLLEFIWG